MKKENFEGDYTYEKDEAHPFYINIFLYGRWIAVYVSKTFYDLYCQMDNTERKREARRLKAHGSVLSLDQLMEESNYEPSDDSLSPGDYADEKLRDEAIDKVIQTLNPEERLICQMLSEGSSQRDIAFALNRSKHYVQDRIEGLRDAFKDIYEAYLR